MALHTQTPITHEDWNAKEVENLPAEIVIALAHPAEPQDRLVMAQACRAWHTAIRVDGKEVLWKPTAVERFPRLVAILERRPPPPDVCFLELFKSQRQLEENGVRCKPPITSTASLSDFEFTVQLMRNEEILAEWSGPLAFRRGQHMPFETPSFCHAIIEEAAEFLAVYEGQWPEPPPPSDLHVKVSVSRAGQLTCVLIDTPIRKERGVEDEPYDYHFGSIEAKMPIINPLPQFEEGGVNDSIHAIGEINHGRVGFFWGIDDNSGSPELTREEDVVLYLDRGVPWHGEATEPAALERTKQLKDYVFTIELSLQSKDRLIHRWTGRFDRGSHRTGRMWQEDSPLHVDSERIRAAQAAGEAPGLHFWDREVFVNLESRKDFRMRIFATQGWDGGALKSVMLYDGGMGTIERQNVFFDSAPAPSNRPQYAFHKFPFGKATFSPHFSLEAAEIQLDFEWYDFQFSVMSDDDIDMLLEHCMPW